jgi:ribosome modulation factor
MHDTPFEASLKVAARKALVQGYNAAVEVRNRGPRKSSLTCPYGEDDINCREAWFKGYNMSMTSGLHVRIPEPEESGPEAA